MTLTHEARPLLTVLLPTFTQPVAVRVVTLLVAVLLTTER
jgi:hypothetical protein